MNVFVKKIPFFVMVLFILALVRPMDVNAKEYSTEIMDSHRVTVMDKKTRKVVCVLSDSSGTVVSRNVVGGGNTLYYIVSQGSGSSDEVNYLKSYNIKSKKKQTVHVFGWGMYLGAFYKGNLFLNHEPSGVLYRYNLKTGKCKRVATDAK